MKFLIDAQLPRRLARRLAELGHDVLHTLDLPEQNRTADNDLTALAMSEDRIVVTKDRDFPIIPLTDDMILQDEPMGSKDKFWCQLPDDVAGGQTAARNFHKRMPPSISRE